MHGEGEDPIVGFKRKCGPVPVVHVEIDDRVPANAFGLKHPYGHCHVVERTEPFTVIRERVMETSPDVDTDRAGISNSFRPPSITIRAATMVPPVISRNPSTMSSDHGSSSCDMSSGVSWPCLMCSRYSAV